MYRTALCIKMLIKLKSQDLVTTKEMAKYLDTNPRNIREFRKELEEAGYKISETRGRYGGYSLDDRSCLPVPALEEDQVRVLEEARLFMKSHPEFTDLPEFEEVIDRFLCSAKAGDINVSLSYHSGTRSLPEPVANMLDTAEEAIRNQESLLLKYQGRDKAEATDVKVDPYHIVCIDDHYYLIGWSHKAKDYRNFKFSEYRMMDLKPTGEHFLKDSFFNYESYIGSNSAFKDKLCVYSVLVKKDAVRLFKEQNWGTGLTLKRTFKDCEIYSFTSDDPYGTYMRLFEFGPDVELLSPSDKREEYAMRMINSIPHYWEYIDDLKYKIAASEKQESHQPLPGADQTTYLRQSADLDADESGEAA